LSLTPTQMKLGAVVLAVLCGLAVGAVLL